MADVWNGLTDSFNKDMAIEEMGKKYKDTYLIIVKPTKEEIIARYMGFNEGFHTFKDELGTVLRLKHETDIEVICKFPERCLFNSNGVALEFIRRPNRQYRRGICKDNALIYSPVKRFWRGDEQTEWSVTLLRDALYPKYPENCEEAIKQLDSQSVVSIALNSKFMLSLSFIRNTKQYVLFYCNVPIGMYDKGVFTIKHPLFRQEVLDNIQIFTPYRVEL